MLLFILLIVATIISAQTISISIATYPATVNLTSCTDLSGMNRTRCWTTSSTGSYVGYYTSYNSNSYLELVFFTNALCSGFCACPTTNYFEFSVAQQSLTRVFNGGGYQLCSLINQAPSIYQCPYDNVLVVVNQS